MKGFEHGVADTLFDQRQCEMGFLRIGQAVIGQGIAPAGRLFREKRTGLPNIWAGRGHI